MEPWRQLAVQRSEDSYEAFRDDSMCCSAVILKRGSDLCRVCGGLHAMIERRLACTSTSCSEIGVCGVIWKIFTCTASDTWTIWVNEHGHKRGVVPCNATHPVRLTPAMKQFLAEQDDIGIPPRLMLVHLKKQTQIQITSRGWPSLRQVQNALKRIRRDQGTKNSRKAVQDLVRTRCYRPDMKTDTAFLFGATLDREGYAYVGLGSDDNSFIIGITSLAMIDGCLRFSNAGLKCQFHADATFKLSDIGYPVITCGFTDKARAYQVGAFFVVSRRTAHEYTECFRSFAALVRDLRGISLQVDTVMGDAEDAQYLGLEAVSVFAGATKLMCYFHLYNVRKKNQHLPIKARMLVLASIVDMHFTIDSDDYEACRQRVLLKWRSTPLLTSFATYFESQWLNGRYWRWQAYHTPGGYASTNNPCENLNGALKLFMQRRRHHMRRLLVKICDFIESITPVLPTTMDYSPKATTEIVEAAITMVESSRVEFETTSDPNLVRVLENISLTAGATSDDEEEEEDFISTFGGDDSPLTVSDAMATGSSRAIDLFRTLTSGGDPGLSDGEGLHDSEHEQDQLIENQGNATEEQEEEVRNRCKDLYTRATKWSLRRSHRIGMPSDGWVVDLRLKICGCRYLSKFQICAHLIAAQQKYGLASYAPNKIEKLLSRVVGKAQTKRNCTKVPKASVQKRATKSKKSRAKGPPTIVQVRPGAEGRPPRASTALLIQDITDE